MSSEKHKPVKDQASGLRYWMERVLAEIDKVRRDFAPDPVHDLRVALRRCRSMADGLTAIDPDKTWKTMRREGRRLFKCLGELRDVQVLSEWARQLGGPDDPVTVAMLAYLAQREQELKQEAGKPLQAFDREKWRGWIARLDARTRRLPLGGAVFQLSAIQAWNEAHELHKQAARNRSNLSYHRLRIGLKKLRYTVENFLPHLHAQWGGDLKNLQDWLGELHDLSVFWEAAVRIRAFPDADSRKRWHVLIDQERERRIGQYRAKMMGDNSLWVVWRAGLPPPSRLQALSLRMIQKWGSFHGINLPNAYNVRRLALQLLDGLGPGKSTGRQETRKPRAILHAAAVLHNLARPSGKTRNNRSARGLLRRLPPSPGLSAESLHLIAMIVHCHRGRFRGTEDAGYASLNPGQRQLVMLLAGILRLARTLSRKGAEPVGGLTVDKAGDSIVIWIEGYAEFGPLAEKLARARYLLECACQRPVLFRSTSTEPLPVESPQTSA